MSWARMDDRFHGNRKVRRAWKACRASVGLHVMAITYSAQHELDGRIDADWPEEMLPLGRERRAAVQALVNCGLWTPDGDAYVINDYLEFNPSRAELEARREAKREAGRKGGVASGKARSAEAGTKHGASPPTNTRPDPALPYPNSDVGGSTNVVELRGVEGHGTVGGVG